MRIAQIAPIVERIPPKKYGGTERVIHALTEELVRRGHQVTLFASGDSRTSAKLVSVTPRSLRAIKYPDPYGMNLPSSLNTGLAYSMQDKFDIIHDHEPHRGLPAANIAVVPVVTVWHGAYDKEIIAYFSVLNKAHVVSISKAQAARAPSLKFAGNVYNGLNMEHYPFSEKMGDYLLFVGRIDKEKAPHVAIEVAAKLKKKLVIAAKIDLIVPHIKKYYDDFFQPALQKHKKLVEWVGEVNERQRNRLMKNALCLLHPVSWPEPFGLALIEAQATGCPVIAFNKGSIPEIIVNGKTGFVVKDFKGMLDAVLRVDKINKLECRNHALENFSAKKMADGYERIYQLILNRKI